MRKVLSGLGGLTIVAIAAGGMYAADASACFTPSTTTTVPVSSTTAPATTSTVPVTSTTIIRLIPPISVVAPKKPVKRIEEDSPAWNCKTMGNRICGPVPVAPAPVRPVSLPHTL